MTNFPEIKCLFSEFSECRKSEKSLKHVLIEFKDPLCYQCFSCTVVASIFLTQEIAGSNTPILQNDIMLRFFRIHLGKSRMLWVICEESE